MSKQGFLDNCRIARSLFVHPGVRTDGPTVDSQELESMVARAAIWLTPKSVKGFNADDFPELGSDQREELRSAINEFLRVAREVPPTEPASQQQLNTARAAFTKVLRILEPYLPEEGTKVEKALENVAFPPAVANWDYELGSDEDGLPAVWVNLYVDETSGPRRELGRLASQMTTKIHQALSTAGSNRWPYVRVRTAVEHKTV